jgi:hypothetical protein
MDDLGACYGIIISNYELRQGLIGEAKRSCRSTEAMSYHWRPQSWLAHALRRIVSGAERWSLIPIRSGCKRVLESWCSNWIASTTVARSHTRRQPRADR